MANTRALRGLLDSEANPFHTNHGTDDRGTKANPIVIKDDSEEEGSQTNPIVIGDNADALGKQETPVQNTSISDTERLSTPDFWANLGDQGFHVPQNKSIETDLACDSPLSQSACGQISNCTCSPQPKSIPDGHLEERSEVAKSDNDEKTPPNKDESCCRIAETNTTSCGQPNFSWSCQRDELKPSTETSQTDNDNPPRPQRSGKRKRGHEKENNSGNRRSNRLANKEKNDRNSSVLIS